MYARCGAGEKPEITSKAYLSLSGGSNSPSNGDKALTQKLVNIFYPLDIKIHDHIIVAGVNFCSMAEKGYMPQAINELASYEPIKIENKNILEENQSFNSQLDEELEL